MISTLRHPAPPALPAAAQVAAADYHLCRHGRPWVECGSKCACGTAMFGAIKASIDGANFQTALLQVDRTPRAILVQACSSALQAASRALSCPLELSQQVMLWAQPWLDVVAAR